MTDEQTPSICPFCAPDASRVFLRLPTVFALWDAFPVSEGHALIVPHRHVATWFDADSDERLAIFSAIETVCSIVRQTAPCNGFNIGINIGQAAGQTVPHLHLHVIPRRDGDVADPRGGVRHVIPGKGNYLLPRPSGELLSAADRVPAASATRFLLAAGASSCEESPGPNADGGMLTTGGPDPLLPALERDIAQADRVDVAVAFVMTSGIERLYPHLDELLQRGGALRLLTGDYLDVSDPDALQRLLDLVALHGADRAKLRMFVSAGSSFHPKAYLMAGRHGGAAAYVGSSNLSATALLDGIEWNFRVSSDVDPVGQHRIQRAFDELFRHPSTVALDDAWIAAYRQRRRPARRSDGAVVPVDTLAESPLPQPQPNAIQLEALSALAETRQAGNRAGLVVMATGLGKTWLAAFDSSSDVFERILFVAHREEILRQALETFRRIRPGASLGLYAGSERTPDAQVVFASIQTLGRMRHLERFTPTAFDYIVVDEFHHASAPTYRRLIDHFEPAFLLGLTATPERSDGGDLLGLCGENLVYRCIVPRGIELGLLCPFQYFGVPDDVDYSNIPWRNARFDEEALTNAVATQRRAENILDQWRRRGAARTIGFCVSQRHADFMARYFEAAGVRCASVHAGASSAPRALSLEQLAEGSLSVIFAVDMFNEGVDVPAIDTVMMLRPTESQIVWLQQFGRGLRKFQDKRLTVIDYIGNHRSFLLKARTLLEIDGQASRELIAALQRAERGELDLPPGCEVTYDLEAMNILRALVPRQAAQDVLRAYYEDFRDRHGRRPTASEAYHDGYLPLSARRSYGSWLGMADQLGDLSGAERAAFQAHRTFLRGLEDTSMTRSYKMLLLLAMLNADGLPGPGVTLAALADAFARVARRSRVLIDDVGSALDDPAALGRLLETHPINAWTGTGAITNTVFFAFADDVFRFIPSVEASQRESFQSMVRELVDWRLAAYLDRKVRTHAPESFEMRVSHAAGRPILFLPDRAGGRSIPEGTQDVEADGTHYRADFVKVAVNVLREKEGGENVLPRLLRGWFGPDAGLSGTNFSVRCEPAEGGWRWTPVQRSQSEALELHRRYSREQIPPLFGQRFSEATWNSGFVTITPADPKHLCLLVTLHKSDMAESFQYGDHFLGVNRFQWQSQNRTTQDGKHGQMVRDHQTRGIDVHLFVRATKKIGSKSAPFVYCGTAMFEDWQGNTPITVIWRLATPLTERLAEEFEVSQPR